MATQTQRPPEATQQATDARWLAFAGAYMMVAGFLNGIWGISALVNKEYFAEDGLIWSSLQTWGWIALLIAVVQVATGAAVYAQRLGAMLVAVLLAMCAMVLNFLTVGAYPVWSVVAIVCNALVLWAVTVHSGAMR